jgi:hypothetical protein
MAPDAPHPPRGSRALFLLIVFWGIGGVALLLLQAILRLAPLALEPLSRGLGTLESVTYASWVGFSVYAEGYRGFQRAFVPRVVARAFYLARSPRPIFAMLAPVFCMALIHARPRRLVASWALFAFIVVAVIFIRRLPYPWRGILDGGVVAGLGYGLVCLCVAGARALAGEPQDHALDLPTA